MALLLFCFTVCQQNKPIINEQCRFVKLHEPGSFNALKHLGKR